LTLPKKNSKNGQILNILLDALFDSIFSMKKTTFIMAIFFVSTSEHSYNYQDNANIYNKPTIHKNLFIEESALFFKKHALFIASIPLIVYYKNNIIDFTKSHPYITTACLYTALNYTCDTILDYTHQNSLLEIVRLLKRASLYLVISHGIHNYIDQINISLDQANIKNGDLLNAITQDLPYSFNDATLIVLKTYQELKSSLYSLNPSLTIESEEFVFLCHASSINMHTISYLVQNNVELYHMIMEFEKNPETVLMSLLEKLKTEITNDFTELEKRLLIYNAPLRYPYEKF